jgi:hypothetical protein
MAHVCYPSIQKAEVGGLRVQGHPVSIANLRGRRGEEKEGGDRGKEGERERKRGKEGRKGVGGRK